MHLIQWFLSPLASYLTEGTPGSPQTPRLAALLLGMFILAMALLLSRPAYHLGYSAPAVWRPSPFVKDILAVALLLPALILPHNWMFATTLVMCGLTFAMMVTYIHHRGPMQA